MTAEKRADCIVLRHEERNGEKGKKIKNVNEITHVITKEIF